MDAYIEQGISLWDVAAVGFWSKRRRFSRDDAAHRHKDVTADCLQRRYDLQL